MQTVSHPFNELDFRRDIPDLRGGKKEPPSIIVNKAVKERGTSEEKDMTIAPQKSCSSAAYL